MVLFAETTSMKGLVVYNLHKKEEGLELVKKGVLLDLTSHICWHVLGIVHTADRNYEEALKSHLQALRFDKENINILRDAAQLQLQLRNFDGLQDTRLTLLKLRPNLRLSWIGLAVAHHLNKQPVDACKVLEQYLNTLKGVPEHDVEYSGLLPYYIRMLEEVERYEDALQTLDTGARARSIVDGMAVMVTRARLFSKLGRSQDAQDGWKALVRRNPESHVFYRGFLLSQGIDIDNLNSETRVSALSVLRDLSLVLPGARAPKRFCLLLSSGDDFRTMAREYLLSGFTRGIPSLYADVKSLYHDHEKRRIIGEIVEELAKQYPPVADSLTSEGCEPPTTSLWILYFLAQHRSFISPTDPSESLDLIDTALSHTPTLPELHMVKARILKRAGDLVGASASMEEARKLDLQDRFLNMKSAKYLLRDGQVEAAGLVLGLFTKKDAASPGSDLEEMQSLLYLVEEANSHMILGRFSMALKRYHSIDKTFNDFEDDQFDFHGYCLRRHTLNAHQGLLKFEDGLRTDPAYTTAAVNAAKIYIYVYDNPSLVTKLASVNQTGEKKAKNKVKKAAAKTSAPVGATKGDDAPQDLLQDEDPDGMKLLGAPDPLLQASKLLRPLEKLNTAKIDVWLMSFDVALRRNKHLQATRALEHAGKLDQENGELHSRIVEFKLAFADAESRLPPYTKPLVLKSLERLVPEGSGISLERFNSEFVQRHPGDGKALLSYAKALWNIRNKEESAKGDIETLIFEIADPKIAPDIQTSLRALDLLETVLKSSESQVGEFRTSLQKRYPFSTIFQNKEERAKLRIATASSVASENSNREMGPI